MAAGNRVPNVTALKEEVSNHGRVVVAKAYADWVTRSPELKGASQFISDPPALYATGIEPVYVPTRLPLGAHPSATSRTTRVKNSVDVKMTADCIECAHSYPNIGTYVLVSGDSDFIHVINSLRAIGKRAIIIGVSWSTSRRLADQVDGLIFYDTDVDPETHHEPAPVPSVQPTGRPGGIRRSAQLDEIMRVIEEVVRAERQSGRIPPLTSLKQRIMRRVPGFDEKKLGFSGFKKLMLRTVEEGNIRMFTDGMADWVILANEPTPQEAQHDSASPTQGSIESVAAEEEVPPSDVGAPEPVSAVAETAEKATAPVAVAATAEAREPEVPDAAPDPSPELERALAEALAVLEMPAGPGDGLDGRRITDLIIMADSLEHREGVSHVAFNFLVAEICDALREGLQAEHAEITSRWGGTVFSRTYVTRLVRGLRGGDVFVQGWHSDRDAETGRARRRRTFNLNRSHPLVEQAIKSQWGDAAPEAVAVAAAGGAGQSDVPAEANDSAASSATVEAATTEERKGKGRGKRDEELEVTPDDAVASSSGEGEVDPLAPAAEDEASSAMARVMRLFRN